MAIYPSNFQGKFNLQPGARGEKFAADMPGFRDGGKEQRVNRTNMSLNVSKHETPAVKYSLDNRLPGLFKLGYSHGYNEVAIPKGRLTSVDKHVNMIDYETKKFNNVLTLSNGGNAVNLRSNDKTQWESAAVNARQVLTSGEEMYYTVGNGAFAAGDGGLTVEIGGEEGSTTTTPAHGVRLANNPIGVMQRNEMTRYEDALNGMQPSPVITDHQIELPLFELKEKAELNCWGSAYGNLKPGDYVKSDENGRFVVSPLSRLDVPSVASVLDSAIKIELERQQIVGQVIEVRKDLVPAGAAKYVQWALSDRMQFEPFNPTMKPQNGRGSEDVVGSTAYNLRAAYGTIGTEEKTTGVDPFDYPGYPFDATMSQHDLHMLASSARKSDLRLGLEHMMDMGIPGLTDGYNAHVETVGPENIAQLYKAENVDDYIGVSMKTSKVDIAAGSLKLCVTTKTRPELQNADFSAVADGITIPVVTDSKSVAGAIEVVYASELQGYIILKVTEEGHKVFTEGAKELQVYAMYDKRGLAGVPTMLDWDGCVGIVSILLQK